MVAERRVVATAWLRPIRPHASRSVLIFPMKSGICKGILIGPARLSCVPFDFKFRHGATFGRTGDEIFDSP
jgi:hypothetical protein